MDQSLVDHIVGEMSANRVRFLRHEWQRTYEWLDPALQGFRSGPHQYSLDGFLAMVGGDLPAHVDAKEVLQGLLTTGIVGLKSRPDTGAIYFFAEEPPSRPCEGKTFVELHPAVEQALRNGTWR